MTQVNGVCTNQKCPANQWFNLFSCQVINCPPPTFFKDGRCSHGDDDDGDCDFGYTWNGQKCSLNPPFCPEGTQWNNFQCQSNNQCGKGFFGNNGNCVPFPQKCIPPSQWDGQKCSIGGAGCPPGTYSQGN